MMGGSNHWEAPGGSQGSACIKNHSKHIFLLIWNSIFIKQIYLCLLSLMFLKLIESNLFHPYFSQSMVAFCQACLQMPHMIELQESASFVILMTMLQLLGPLHLSKLLHPVIEVCLNC